MRLTSKVVKRFDIPNDDDNGWVEIEHLKDNVIEAIKAKTNDNVVVDGGVEVRINLHEQKELIVDACLKDFGNLFDESGRPLKFTAKNVAKCAEFTLFVGDDKKDFYTWIDDCRQELADKVEEQEKVASKN